MSGDSRHERDRERELDLRWSAALAAGALLLYGLTAARTVAAGDSTEFALVFARFGVAHAPGYALQSLLSSLLVHALFFLEPAFAANLLSSLWAALASGLCFHVLRALGSSRAAAAFAALALACGRTFWSQAVVAEVYTFDVLLLLGVLASALRAFAQPTPRRALLLGLLAASSLLHRSVNVLYLPGLFALASSVGRPPVRALLSGVARGSLLALIPLLYLPIAASFDPPLRAGDPSTLAGLIAHVTGSAFGHLLALSPERAVYRLTSFATSLPLELGLGLLLAGVAVYGVSATRERRRVALGLASIVATNLVFVAVYEIPDFEPYLLPTTLALVLAAGLVADDAMQALGLAGNERAARALIAAGVSGALLNFGANDRSSERILRTLGEDVLASVEPRALLLVQGDTVANVLLYLQYVERRAPEVLVVYASLSQPWYHAHLRRLHAREAWPPFDPNEPWPARAAGLVEALDSRPAHFTTELDPEFVLQRGPLGRRWPEKYVLRPTGLTIALAPRAEPAPSAAQIATTIGRLESSARAAAGLRLDADIDSKVTYLQYAAALTQLGSAALPGDAALARSAQRAALEMKPEAYELSYLEEQGRRLGEPVQPLGIAQRARVGLSRAERTLALGGGAH